MKLINYGILWRSAMKSYAKAQIATDLHTGKRKVKQSICTEVPTSFLFDFVNEQKVKNIMCDDVSTSCIYII
jgi:hypothetical protein